MTLTPSAAQANFDARSQLGIRPGARPTPRVYIEEPIFEDVPPSPKAPDYCPPSPNNRHISIAIPSGLSSHASAPSTSPAGPSSETNRRFRRPTLSRKLQPANLTLNRGLYETQKLLAHLIERLETRDQAPNVLDRAAIAARETNGQPRVRSKTSKFGQVVAAATFAQTAQPNPPPRAGISSEDVEDKVLLDEGEWDTEETVDLVEQMRGLLVLAEKQGLDLFGTTMMENPNPDSAPSPVRNKRKAGRFSSIASPLASKGDAESETAPSNPTFSTWGTPLLQRLISLLRSLVMVDGIHRVHLFRPLRPPFALQVACLDIAAYLYRKCSIETKLDVLEIVIDALYVMSDVLAVRLCEWLEGRLEELLTRLARDRGKEDEVNDLEWHGECLGLHIVNILDPFAGRPPNLDIPTFAFSADPDPDEAQQPAKSGWMRYSPTSPHAETFPPRLFNISGVLSTHIALAHFSSATLRIAALVPRILIAISSTIDLATSKLTTIHRVHRLLALILTAKADASLDLLEIIAHAPPIPRKRALSILTTFYSDVTGHNTIARRPALSTYETLRNKWETGQEKVLGEDDTQTHNYIPWRVTSIKNGKEEKRCAACQAVLQGFCVKCTLCDDIRHLHCHQPPSDQMFIYDVVILGASESTHHTVCVKFSKCHRRLDEKVLDGSPIWGNENSVRRRAGQHGLHLVNIFSVALCGACHKPLWGLTQQAYACVKGCQTFYHPSCVEQLEEAQYATCRFRREVFIDESPTERSADTFSITTSDLQKSCDAHVVLQSAEDAVKLSYDETMIRYFSLWTQYQLLKNGIASGSIRIISEQGRRADSDVLGLRRLLKSNEDRLRLISPSASSAIVDFSHVTQTELTQEHDIMWTPRYLAYCTALLRAPATMTTNLPSEGLLTVEGTSATPSPVPQEASHVVYETVPMAHIRHSLSTDMNIKDDVAASLFLEQLRLLGLLALPRRRAITPDIIRESETELHFYIPLLMDSSSTVELLILAIESLLTDLDLTSNEHGFSLLLRRAWPSLLCSPYALERLGNAVMGWVMGEVVKEYASKRKRIPGVRGVVEVGKKGGVTVGMYKEDRLKMMIQYAKPWLEALHQQDRELYAHIAYEQCKAPLGWDIGEVAAEEAAAQVAGAALERMAALGDAGVVFSVLMDLLTAWLEDLGELSDKDVVYKSLPRLLARPEIRQSGVENSSDLWTLADETSRDGPEEFRSVCRWMRVLAFSGVEIPWYNLTSLLDLQTSVRSSIEAKLDLTIAIGANSTSIEPEAFAQMASQALAAFTESLERKSTTTPPTLIEVDVLRHTLLLVLRAYSVPQDEIVVSHLIQGQAAGTHVRQPTSLAKKRRVAGLRPPLIPLDAGMVVAASSLLRMPNFPMEMMLDFFWLLFTKAPAVDNVGGFLHHLCSVLYEAIWLLYDKPVDRQCRTRVFLKLLTINTVPIEKLVSEQLDGLDRARIQERLLTLVIELADESVTFEVAGWQSPTVGLLLLFLDSLLDPTDVSPDNIIILRSLLPSHLKAMARCFEDYLVQSSDERRLTLLSRLQRLRFLVPSWPVLEELLVEQVTNITHFRKSDSQQSKDARVDAEAVRANLLALGLDMLASEIEIDWISMQKFQQQVASACITPWSIDQVSNITALVLPGLRQVLDTTAKVPVEFGSGNGVVGGSLESNKSKKTAIAGSLFVSIAVDFSTELRKHDFIADRCILDILMVMFFKQNVQAVELSALSTLQTLADFADKAGCAENRLLAIHILQTALTRMQKESSARVVPSICCTIAKILNTEASADGDPAVAEQCRVYLRSAIGTFGRSGLFLQLFRADTPSTTPGPNSAIPDKSSGSLGRALHMLLSEEPREAPPRPSLSEMIFGDLLDLFKRGKQTCQQVINSLYTFVDALDAELSEEAAQNFGAFVTRFGKHIGDWSSEDFDPNALLNACGKLLSLVPPSYSVTLLHQTSTFLHLALNHFNVRYETIVNLSQASHRVVCHQRTDDTIATVLSEVAGAAVNGSFVTPVTLYSLLTFLVEPVADTNVNLKATPQRLRVLVEASPGCVSILLRSHQAISTTTHFSGDSELLINILSTAGRIIVRSEEGVNGNISRILTNITSEAVQVQISVFIYILLASLDIDLGPSRKGLLTLYPLIARATALCIHAASDHLTLQDPSGEGAELLSTSFAIARLAILGVEQLDGTGDENDDTKVERHDQMNGSDGVEESLVHKLGSEMLNAFWERVWPDWSRLLTLSLDESCINGPLRAVSHSVFLDLILFLSIARPTLLITHSRELTIALNLLVHWHEQSGIQPGPKLVKAMSVVNQSPLALESGLKIGRKEMVGVVKAVRTDLVAMERLRSLRTSL